MGESIYFAVGETDSLSRTITAADVDAFAALSGDQNPIHLDEAYAAKTRFGRRIAHGMLVASYISTLLGTKFPGSGTIYMSQTLNFLRPVFLGDTLTVTATVTNFRSDKAIATLATIVTNQRGETILSGEAGCLVRDCSRGKSVASGAAAG
jgi:3-hydroxybutyryl-CoA dehydratase